MHALQSGGRSPKHLNGPTLTQQLRSGSDGVQNSGTSFPPQVKGKKRERGQQGIEPIKREHNTKIDEEGIANMIKAEVATITEKGGLVNFEGVEKLVHLMQLDRAERKIELAGRVLLADVIAATDTLDCLDRFVQLRGVTVLDDWLQETHKGKTGDGSSPKESDKSVEDLLLSLLRSLDKLPINLDALQTCNIGKSVNHLRNHKNPDIQRKARSLIDTWKKRVDAEMMKINDAKSVESCQTVSWPAKQGFPEVSHGGRRAGSTETIMRSSTIHPSTCKAQPGKPGHTEGTVKSLSVTPGASKSSSTLPAAMTVSSKDLLIKGAGSSGALNFAPMIVKEEKSGNSGQSQNSLSGSGDHARMMSSLWKEDSKSSISRSMNTSKITGGSLRHRRSNNGLITTTDTGISRDNMVKIGSHNRTATSEKISESGLACERTPHMPAADHGDSHRLTVRLPNPGHSPARSASGGSFEDPSIVGSRASSPGDPDKHDHIDFKIKVKGDAFLPNISTNVNAESWHSNDVKEGLAGSEEVDRSQGGTLYEEHCRSVAESGRTTDGSRATRTLSGNEKEIFLVEDKAGNSFSSINALIESCARFCEAGGSLLADDDTGMNLLASVAAGEMSKSNLVSPAGSPRSSPAAGEPSSGNSGVKLRASCFDVAQSYSQPIDPMDIESEKNGMVVVPVATRDELQETGNSFSSDDKAITSLQEAKLLGEQAEQHAASSMTLHSSADPVLESEVKPKEERSDGSVYASTPAEMKGESDGEFHDKWKATGQVTDYYTVCKPLVRSPSVDESKRTCRAREKIEEGEGCIVNNVSSDGKHEVVAEESLFFPPNMDVQKHNVTNEGLSGATLTKGQVAPAAAVDLEANNRSCDDAATSPDEENVMHVENAGEINAERVNSARMSCLEPSNGEGKETPCFATSIIDQAGSMPCNNGIEEVRETKQALVHHSAGSGNHEEPFTNLVHEADQHEKPSGSVSGFGSHDRMELGSSSVAILAVSAEPDIASERDFDLNEGFPGDDGNQSEPATSANPVHSAAICLHNLSPLTAPVSNGLPASITVAAPAKGPFVPPENLLKSKGEPGWKGSAATSAFRPAEPRKVLEMPLNTSDIPLSDATTWKQGRQALDIDLNVPDERILEDMASQSSAQIVGSKSGAVSDREVPTGMAGGLDLDLNKVDEGMENGQFLGNNCQKVEVPLLPIRPLSAGFPKGESIMSRDFDLNGPSHDDVGVEPAIRIQQVTSASAPLLTSFAGLRVNNAELRNMSSWFPSGNSYPAVAIPSIMPDRGEQPYPIVPVVAGSQRVWGSDSGRRMFGGDIYQGPVLSSSPTMAFSHATTVPYAGFPFGPSFPLVSSSFSGGSTTYVDSLSGSSQGFSTIPSQLVGPSGAASSHYLRHYMISLPEGSASGGLDSNRKLSRQGLDLNAGLGGAGVEGRDDRLAMATRQLPVAISQAFAEEQARVYQVAGGGLKRKDPDGGWDAERYAYKQPAWQ